MFDSSGKDQVSQKIAQVVGQNKQSQHHLIRDKALAGQPRPVQGILAFLDPLLGPAATVVKVNHPLGSCAPVGQDETDSRKEFAAMPLDLGNHPTRPVPTGRLIFEIGKPNDGFSGWAPHRSGQQVFNLRLKHLVGGKPEGIQKALLLQVFINLRLGEGGITPHHRHGGDLIWQLGTGYFGCRTENGGFDLDLFKERVETNPVRAVEIKLSQGAKPGLGGLLPGAKVTPEIARIRGVPVGEDVYSPATHSAFGGVDEMLDFVEMLAETTGLPIGPSAAWVLASPP